MSTSLKKTIIVLLIFVCVVKTQHVVNGLIISLTDGRG